MSPQSLKEHSWLVLSAVAVSLEPPKIADKRSLGLLQPAVWVLSVALLDVGEPLAQGKRLRWAPMGLEAVNHSLPNRQHDSADSGWLSGHKADCEGGLKMARVPRSGTR